MFVLGGRAWGRHVRCLGVLALALAALHSSAPAARAAAELPATFTVTGIDRPVPRSFLGVSMEYNELHDYERVSGAFDRVLSLIKPEDGSRMLLRIGGKSADHVYWHTTRDKRPQWVSLLGTGWLSRLSSLVAPRHLRVMLDLNLAVHSPRMESNFARAAQRALPRGSLAGLEVGNEPDLYWRQTQLEKQRISNTDVGRGWAQGYSAADYRRDYASYARALSAALPGIPLGGPETISSDPDWLSAVEDLGRLTPRFLTIHRYASSTCWPPSSPWYPTLATILDERASAGLASSAAGAVGIAHASGQTLRVSELNSISCGGNKGVANAFATALWAPDALFEMLHAGVDGADWHLRPGAVNAPFLVLPHAVRAMPELYGLAMFSQMTWPGAQLMSSTLAAPAGLHLKAWAVSFPAGMRILLINKGAQAAAVMLRLGRSGHAFVKRLTAPGIGASTGIRFGGQSIGPQGRWRGRLRAPAVPIHNGNCRIDLPGYSAALLSVWH